MTVPATRKPRLLWANAYCLLDTSSGASMAVREMLRQLVAQGYEVQVLGATVFDHEQGTTRLKPHWDTIQEKLGELISAAVFLFQCQTPWPPAPLPRFQAATTEQPPDP